MNELKVMKTAMTVSRTLNFLSTVATITAILTIVCATFSCFKR